MSLIKTELINEQNKSIIWTHPKDELSLYNNAIVLEGHKGTILGSRFSKNGLGIASCGIDKTIKIWELPTNKENTNPSYGILNGHKSAVTSVRWLFDDSLIYSSSADKTVGIWDVETGKRIRNNKFHELTVNEIDVYNTSLGLSVSDDGYALIWDEREKNPTGKVKTEFPLLSGVINNKGNTFYISGIDPSIKAYDFRILDKPLWECNEQKSSISSLAINRDDTSLIARTFEGPVLSLNTSDHLAEGNLRISSSLFNGATSGIEYQLIRVNFHPNSTFIASGSEDKNLTTWNYNSASSMKYEGHTGTVIDVDYHPYNDIIVSSSTDGTMIVREIS